VDNLGKKFFSLTWGLGIQSSATAHQYRRQLPDLQLLGGGFLALAMAAVIPLLQLLLGGEGAQAMIQVYGLHLLPPTYGNGLVIHPKLKRDKCYYIETKH